MVKIDFSYLEILSEDDDDFKKEYLETFHGNYTTLTAKMMSELKGGDFEALGKTAHQLKPTATMIQLPCSQSLEELQNKPEGATEAKIQSIHDECADAYQQLVKWAGV